MRIGTSVTRYLADPVVGKIRATTSLLRAPTVVKNDVSTLLPRLTFFSFSFCCHLVQTRVHVFNSLIIHPRHLISQLFTTLQRFYFFFFIFLQSSLPDFFSIFS